MASIMTMMENTMSEQTKEKLLYYRNLILAWATAPVLMIIEPQAFKTWVISLTWATLIVIPLAALICLMVWVLR